jgi:hypothetical protein
LRPIGWTFHLATAFIAIAILMRPTGMTEDQIAASTEWIDTNFASLLSAMTTATIRI